MSPHGSPWDASTPGTCCRMVISSLAVLALITRRCGAAAAGVNFPEPLLAPAMAWYTLAICTALTATPWPNDSVYRSSPHHLDGGFSRPALSPGSPSPDGEPSPKARK